MVTGNSSQNRSLWVPGLIFAVCVVPLVAAYLVYSLWPPHSRMNYGTLLDPQPISSESFKHIDGSRFSMTELRGRWVMLQVDGSACSSQCRRKLYKMRQVRLTQGRKMGYVERVWIVLDRGSIDAQLLRDYAGTHVARAESAASLKLPAERNISDHIYLIDPRGNVMLRFPKDADPSLMKKDLERLLKVSNMG